MISCHNRTEKIIIFCHLIVLQIHAVGGENQKRERKKVKKKEQDNVIHQNSKTWNKEKKGKMEDMNFFLLLFLFSVVAFFRFSFFHPFFLSFFFSRFWFSSLIRKKIYWKCFRMERFINIQLFRFILFYV